MEPKHLSPPRHLLSNHRPLSSHAAAAGQQHMASTAAYTAGSLSHTSTHSAFFHSWNYQFPPQEYLKELRIILFQRALYNYHAVKCFIKEISISYFIITISASNLYMPMIWLYLFLLDFLIPFLCDPDLQCVKMY
jgi:hypothetical protein